MHQCTYPLQDKFFFFGFLILRQIDIMPIWRDAVPHSFKTSFPSDDIIQVDQSIIGAAAAFIANVKQSEVFKGGNENRLLWEDNSNEIVSSWNWNDVNTVCRWYKLRRKVTPKKSLYYLQIAIERHEFGLI